MAEQVNYFSYGSNLSILRLKERTPSAIFIGSHFLREYDLRFHKVSKDGSGKCDAYFTGNVQDIVHGALYRIDKDEKPALDKAEGLGYGYEEIEVLVVNCNGSNVRAITYVATHIDESLKPYSWYLNHVLLGAKETKLPDQYVAKKIQSIEVTHDPNVERDQKQRKIYD